MYGNSVFCGACIKGSGNGKGSGGDPIGHFEAYVIDSCEGCGDTGLDFYDDTGKKDGKWEIKWRFVRCPAVEDPTFVFQGSNDNYWKLQPRGFATPVKKLKVSGNSATRVDDNFFVVDGGYPLEGEQQVETTTIMGAKKITPRSLLPKENTNP